ncbi:hypothetical protein ACJDT4_10695 [Clostridium neuense]|uniref:Uncharacterized protein n=1 Tax=Clostridium neuense TaxID=1728934 RepID=A0ABW8TFX9_9CLOT
MEYDINLTSGCDIDDFYRDIIQEILIEEVFINTNIKIEIRFLI